MKKQKKTKERNKADCMDLLYMGNFCDYYWMNMSMTATVVAIATAIVTSNAILDVDVDMDPCVGIRIEQLAMWRERATNTTRHTPRTQQTKDIPDQQPLGRYTRTHRTSFRLFVIVVAILLLLFIFIKYISLSCCNFIKT